MNEVQIDLDAVNPIIDTAPEEVEEVMVVFVPFEDKELRVNQTTKKFSKGRAAKVTRDEARILLEAKIGYIKD